MKKLNIYKTQINTIETAKDIISKLNEGCKILSVEEKSGDLGWKSGLLEDMFLLSLLA